MKKEELNLSLWPDRTAFTLCLDLLLLAAFVLLLSPRMTGLPLHELIGVAFCVPVIVHLLIAWPWISQSTKRLITKADRRAKVNYVLNTVLFVLVAVEIVSGVVISQVVLPSVGLRPLNDQAWRALHNLTLNWTLLAVGLHVALNWEWIVAAFRRRILSRNGIADSRVQIAPTLAHAFLRIGLFVLAAGIIAAVAYAILGPPSLTRLYAQDEIGRFAPTLGHGIMQFAGEAFLIALVAYVGRRWLRVRL